MDIYNFINSNAIAEHCRKLNHQFTPVEMAYLIRESEKHTIPEKHAAYRELIDTTPDMPVEAGGWRSDFDSLHRFLEQYMAIENKYLERFYQDEQNVVYSYKCRYKGDSGYSGDECLYKNFQTCYAAIREDIHDTKDLAELFVEKRWLVETEEDKYIRDLTLCITYDNIPVELGNDAFHFLHDEEYAFEDTFEDIWPVMPTPFKRGDILTYKTKRSVEEEVLVIDWVPYWECDDAPKRMYGEARNSPHSLAFRQADDGSIYSGMAPVYTHLDFYDGKLKGKKRILKAISSYLKGELNFEMLISAYSFLMCDEYVSDEDYHMYTLLGPALFEGKAGVRGPFEDDEETEEPEESLVSGIYSFINSDAIAKHCSQINHQFSPIEAAYLIHESEKHTIPEKHAAWKKLIETTPDMEVKERNYTPRFESLHAMLERYMEIENKYIDLFYRDEPNCVYSFQYLYEEDSTYVEDEGLYPDFHTCYERVKAEIDDPAEIIDLRVTKRWLSRGDEEYFSKLTLCITCDNIPVTLWDTCGCMDDEEDKVYSVFQFMWPEIPTPFQKGDILIAKSKYIEDPKPFVLNFLPYWAEDGREWLVDMHRERGDESDMYVMGYCQEWNDTLCYLDGPNYLKMEYYEEDLVGSERYLIAVSEFLKGELDIEALMYAYDLLKCKDFADNERQHLKGYGEEVCIKAGIQEETDKDEDDA